MVAVNTSYENKQHGHNIIVIYKTKSFKNKKLITFSNRRICCKRIIFIIFFSSTTTNRKTFFALFPKMSYCIYFTNIFVISEKK